MKTSIVVASTLNDCIGLNNSLPWKLPKDMKRFKDITSRSENSVVVMGRKTYQSIVSPLPKRINHVLTKDLKFAKSITSDCFSSIEDVIENIKWWESFFNIEYDVFFIGGSNVFKEAIEKGYVDTIYHTLIHTTIEGDTFLKLPDWNISEVEEIPADEKNEFSMTFRTLTRP